MLVGTVAAAVVVLVEVGRLLAVRWVEWLHADASRHVANPVRTAIRTGRLMWPVTAG